jgi:hypothetical protein
VSYGAAMRQIPLCRGDAKLVRKWDTGYVSSPPRKNTSENKTQPGLDQRQKQALSELLILIETKVLIAAVQQHSSDVRVCQWSSPVKSQYEQCDLGDLGTCTYRPRGKPQADSTVQRH